MRKITPYIILLFVGVSLEIFGQEYAYRNYTIHDGLVQMQVQCVFQDSRGFLWIGTKGGVSKFDGEKFENFKKSDGLAGLHINDIIEDNEGTIWFASKYGLTKYDGISLTPFPYDLFWNQFITCDAENRIWITNDQMSPHFFDGKSYKKVSQLEHLYCSGINYSKKQNRMLFSADSTLWAYQNGSLSKLRDNKYKNIIFQKQYNIFYIELLTTDGITILLEESLNDFDTVLMRNGTEILSHSLRRDYHYFDEQDFFKIDAESGDIKIMNTFSSPEVDFDYLDNEGNLWIESDEGLIQFFGEGFQNYSQEPFHYVWSFLEDNDGTLWFASYDKGLFQFDGQKIVENYDYAHLTKGNNDFYYGALKDSRGILWFPHSRGLLKKNSENWELIQWKPSNNSVVYLFEDKEREQLIACVKGGICLISFDGNSKFIGIEHGIHKNTYTTTVGKDKNGHYWIGSEDGLTRWDFDQDSLYQYTTSNGKLSSNGVISVFQDYKGSLWFGGLDGLLKYDYQKDSIQKIGENELMGVIKFINSVDSSYLILGTNKGLYFIDLQAYYKSQTLNIKLFNHLNGYMGIEPRANDFYTDSEGNIWVGSSTITCKINPDKLSLETTPLTTYISSVNGLRVGFGKDTMNYRLGEGINEAKISFEAVGFSRPLQTQYSYSIDNGDEWSAWQEEDYVYLSNLASGTHVFKVKSKTVGINDGDIRPATLLLTIDLSFWKEPHFNQVAMTLSTILLLLIFWVSWREKRTRITAKENAEKVKYLQVQTLQAQMNPHFIFNVLGTLQNLILNSDTKKANEHLVNLSTLIRRFLDSSVSSNIPKGISSENEISLEKELELLKMYIDFECLQYENTFDYELITTPKMNPANISIPPMLIQPYVENAIKHGLRYREDKGFLSVRFDEEEESIICIVEDNGVGRKKAKEIQQASIKMYKSHGTNLVTKRVNVLNEMGYAIKIKPSDRVGGGTIIKIKIAYQT